ncbi:Proteins containing regions of low-complexity [Phaffia rhodozyma]|uniref:Proteins containing regions of low-complexity n=1 Tax=Phaffia rhodozyma TaxID=264483 RepID=A0A0F7SSA7_PHARH|nr:Proteins containing regions of low-complexity [Phaffia rhodozyma]
MFSLPSALGLYSSSEDTKLNFRTKQGGIKRLFSRQLISTEDHKYWEQYYTLFDSASEVYSLITLEDSKVPTPQNIETLLSYLTDHLDQLIASPSFPSPLSSKSSLSSYLPSNPSSSSANLPSTTVEAINCLRVIGRILPVLYEIGWPPAAVSGLGGEGWVELVLWSAREEVVQAEEEPESIGQFVVGDDEEESVNESDGGERVGESVPDTPRKPLSPPLADRLFTLAVDLLFCAGFTIPSETVDPQIGKVSYCIWEKGIGSTISLGNSAPYESNKIEVLRFLQILLSTPMFTPPPLLPSLRSPPLHSLTQRLPKRKTLSLLCSLLNTFLNPSQAGWLDGVKNVPFGYLVKAGLTGSVGSATDAGNGVGRDRLRKGAADVLLCGLDYWYEDEDRELGKGNSFQYFLSKLHRSEDFEFILKSILNVFNQHLQMANGLFSSSSNTPLLLLETFMLFWKLIDLNKKFRAFILSDEKRTVEIMAHTVFTCLRLKDDPAHHGLLRMCAYILQTISSEKAFGQAISKNMVSMALPLKWAIQGTAADFMIVSIYSIATTPELNSLFPALTITIANVAPYLQDTSVQASTKLVQLFTALSNPGFMLRDEGHPRLVNYLLETFCSVIFHRLDSNPNLIYSILGASHTFQFLATFTLKTGLREVQRIKKSRELAAVKRAENTRGNVAPSNEKTAFLSDMDSSTLSNSELNQRMSNAALSTHSLSSGNPPEVDRSNSAQDSSLRLVENARQKPLSEKARGKRREGLNDGIQEGGGLGEERERGDEDDGLDEELEKIRTGGLGGGFQPTQDWVTSWQKGLPLDPILLMISELLPKVEARQMIKTQGPNKEILQLLREVTLTDVLPSAPPIVARKFFFSPTSLIWETSLLWGEIYVAGLAPVGLWTGTTIKLFGVKSAPPGRRDLALQNVQSTLTSVFRSSTSSSSPTSMNSGLPSSPRLESRRRQSSSFSMTSLGGGGTV